MVARNRRTNMGMPGCACIPPDGDDWNAPWLRECDHHKAQRLDAERWKRALSAYERGVLMSSDGRTGERGGYISEFLAAIRERDGAA
jgi:hypothetical protein